MIKAIAAWASVALLYVFTAAGIWALYDDCFSEDDYNLICRKSYMAAHDTVRDLVRGQRTSTSTDGPH